MGARLKSSVLRREERGVGSITMGRLIAAAMIGGLGFFGLRLLGIPCLMIPGGLGCFVLALVLTSRRHGMPRYRYALITLRAQLLLRAQAAPQSWQAQLVNWLGLTAERLTLDSTLLLAAPVFIEAGSFDDWEIVPDSLQAQGFEVVTDTAWLEGSAPGC